MKLTTEEQARLSKLQAIKAEDLSAEEKAELEALQEKEAKEDDSYKGDLTQEAFNRMYAENKASRDKAKAEKEERERLQGIIDAEKLEAEKKKGEFEKLYNTEKETRENLEKEVAQYREANLNKWTELKKNFPPNIAELFKEGDEPTTIAENLANYDKFVKAGLITEDGTPAKGAGNPGGHKDLTWEKMLAEPGLAMKIKSENPQLYEELRKKRKSRK